MVYHKNLTVDGLRLIAGKEQNGVGLIHYIGLRQRKIHMLCALVGKPECPIGNFIAQPSPITDPHTENRC